MKRILLTGDSRGVGLSISQNLKKQDYEVVGISRSGDILSYDLQDSDGIKDFFHEKIKPHGPFDGFVNNAAIAYDDLITNLDHSKLEKMFKVNVFSPMMLTKFIIRDMILNKKSGSIVHISSISAHTGYKGLGMYAATKGAIEAFSKNTAREWGQMRIRSNVVCPGFMDTDMSSSLNDSQKKKIFNRNSRRKPIVVEDVAKSVSFLLSAASNGITGQVLHVDNGTI